MPAPLGEIVQRLRDGKAELRRTRRATPIEEKLRELVRAQHLYVQLAGSRRELKSWQHPWNILSDVRESVVIKDGSIEVLKKMPTAGVSRSQWVRPDRPWVLPL